MKKLALTLTLLMLLLVMNPAVTEAQFRQEQNSPTVSERIGVPYSPSNSSMVLGFLDPSKLDMQHSYTVSFSSAGGATGSLGLYRNRISYSISPKMEIIADIGYLHQPFTSFGSDGPGVTPGLTNGTLLYGGEIRYRPTENTYLNIRLGNMPRPSYGYYNRYPYRGYDSPYWY